MAAMYGVYHGPDGLRAIAGRVHALTHLLERELCRLGLTQRNASYFDTLQVDLPIDASGVRERAVAAGINFRYIDDRAVGIALNETVDTDDLRDIVHVFAAAMGRPAPVIDLDAWSGNERGARPAQDTGRIPAPLRRSSPFMTHPVFNTHRSETEMMRYIRQLERKDIGLDTSMIRARFVHDEAERGRRDAAGDLGAFQPRPSVRTGRPGAGLRGDLPRPRSGALRDHRVRRRIAAAEFGRAGGIRRIDGDSGVPRVAGRTGTATSCSSRHRRTARIQPAPRWPACASSSWLRLPTATSTSPIFGGRRPSTARGCRA